MKIIATTLPGLYIIQPLIFSDARGSFVKTYRADQMIEIGINPHFQEEYYSVSKVNVLRGMHFQIPPFDHAKLVSCLVGSVLDVLVDLRAGPTYGEVLALELHAHTPLSIFIPKGVAHGFLSLSDDSMMLYKTSTIHSPEHDKGILWNSIDFKWPCIKPITSFRDDAHPLLKDFNTPFNSIDCV